MYGRPAVQRHTGTRHPGKFAEQPLAFGLQGDDDELLFGCIVRYRHPTTYFVEGSFERYERRTVVITSNLVFSQWNQIFKDPMTTAAAIDRVVHHSIIVEFGKEMPSHRAAQAAQNQQESPEMTPA